MGLSSARAYVVKSGALNRQGRASTVPHCLSEEDGRNCVPTDPGRGGSIVLGSLDRLWTSRHSKTNDDPVGTSGKRYIEVCEWSGSDIVHAHPHDHNRLRGGITQVYGQFLDALAVPSDEYFIVMRDPLEVLLDACGHFQGLNPRTASEGVLTETA